MFPRPKTRTDVQIYTAAASLFSVALTLCLVPLAFEMSDPVPILVKSACIALCSAVPITWVLWNEMYKNEEMSERLRAMANIDPLTEAATRRYFFEHMALERDPDGVSLMIDIDNFKAINDTYGHLTGDEVIRRVAAEIQNAVRSEDIVCRFGGEEFLVFLRNRSAEQARQISERVRKTICQGPMLIRGEQVTVTVSIGGSPKAPSTDINRSIADADTAMYLAKTTGRNKTVFAPVLRLVPSFA